MGDTKQDAWENTDTAKLVDVVHCGAVPLPVPEPELEVVSTKRPVPVPLLDTPVFAYVVAVSVAVAVPPVLESCPVPVLVTETSGLQST